jgi:hypothetical protein
MARRRRCVATVISLVGSCWSCLVPTWIRGAAVAGQRGLWLLVACGCASGRLHLHSWMVQWCGPSVRADAAFGRFCLTAAAQERVHVRRFGAGAPVALALLGCLAVVSAHLLQLWHGGPSRTPLPCLDALPRQLHARACVSTCAPGLPMRLRLRTLAQWSLSADGCRGWMPCLWQWHARAPVLESHDSPRLDAPPHGECTRARLCWSRADLCVALAQLDAAVGCSAARQLHARARVPGPRLWVAPWLRSLAQLGAPSDAVGGWDRLVETLGQSGRVSARLSELIRRGSSRAGQLHLHRSVHRHLLAYLEWRMNNGGCDPV